MQSAKQSLAERQKASTRELIVRTAFEMLEQEPFEHFSHETLAKRAGMSARTVYRHFPNRAELLRELWEHLREATQTRFPQSEDDILPFVHTQFQNFEEHEALVRASLVASATRGVITHGSSEGRQAFTGALARLSGKLSEQEGNRLLALCLAIYSAPFWQMLKDRGRLSSDEAADAAAWALKVILAAADPDPRQGQAAEPLDKEG